MKFALIMILAGYLPLQGPMITGQTIDDPYMLHSFHDTAARSGPTISYVLKDSEKSCKEYLFGMKVALKESGQFIYAACVPSPTGNLCHDFWRRSGDPLYASPNEGCIVEIGDGFGATLGEAPLE